MSETLDPPAPVDPPTSGHRWISTRRIIVTAAVVGAVATLVLVVVFFLSSTFTMHGTITSNSQPPQGWRAQDRDTCDTYDGVGPGKAVTVYNHLNVPVANGQLDTGTSAFGYRCEYSFTVTGVPTGEPTYTIEIAGAGSIVQTPTEARNPSLCVRSYSYC